MPDRIDSIQDLDHVGMARRVIDMFHRIIVYYALWFTEISHQMGSEKAWRRLRRPPGEATISR